MRCCQWWTLLMASLVWVLPNGGYAQPGIPILPLQPQGRLQPAQGQIQIQVAPVPVLPQAMPGWEDDEAAHPVDLEAKLHQFKLHKLDDPAPGLEGLAVAQGVGLESLLAPKALGMPLALAFDDWGHGWVLDYAQQTVVRLEADPTGEAPLVPRAVIKGLRRPIDLAIGDGWLYVCDEGQVLRWRLHADGTATDRQVVFERNDARMMAVRVTLDQQLLIVVLGEGDSRIWAAELDGSGAEPLSVPQPGRTSVAVDAELQRFTGETGQPLYPGSATSPLPLLSAHLDSGRTGGLEVYDGIRFPVDFREARLVARPMEGSVVVVSGPLAGNRMFQTHELRGGRITIRDSVPMHRTFALVSAEAEQFQPTHAVTAPDGSIWVVDALAGRLLRATWQGDPKVAPLRAPKPLVGEVSELSVFRLMTRLSSADRRVREAAMRELVRREAREALLAILRGPSEYPHTQAMALAGLSRLYDPSIEDRLLDIVDRGQYPLDSLAAELVGRRHSVGDRTEAVLDRLGEHISTYSQWMQFEGGPRLIAVIDASTRIAGRLPNSHYQRGRVANNLLIGLNSHRRVPVQPTDMLIYRGLERLGADGLQVLVELAEVGQHEDRERMVQAIEQMTAPQVVAVIQQIEANPHIGLTDTQRSRLQQRREFLEDRHTADQGEAAPR